MYRVTFYFDRYVETLGLWVAQSIRFCTNECVDDWIAGATASGIKVREIGREPIEDEPEAEEYEPTLEELEAENLAERIAEAGASAHYSGYDRESVQQVMNDVAQGRPY
jgi:hypothetical protein